MQLLRLLMGRPLASSEQSEQKIGVLGGVPAMGLDALASAAYGPEAALIILAPLGAASLFFIGPISIGILILLGILYFSYRQTIAAYPGGGGSYTVAKENLGTRASLVAAAALMLDYILNVAVGVSAGVGALTSALPDLQPYTLALCLGVLALITLVNLRGTIESGWAFALPTYTFVLCLGGVMIAGVIQALRSGGRPEPVAPPPPLAPAAEMVSLWLLLHAFASGCTAMTGVEAVSNGITAFREPAVPRARWTLTTIIAILAALLGGIAYLAVAYRIGATDQTEPGYQSVLSQLTGAVVGRGAVYFVTMVSVLAVVSLSANTSFVDFPRLCRLVAADGYLPCVFTVVGPRLVYTGGILFLAGSSALLLVAFGGITVALIPLFAVGAFLAFTLSQAGMVEHWRKQLADASASRTSRAHAHLALWFNGLGAVGTAAALAVIVIAKFVEGAWITVLMLPLLLGLFAGIKRHYNRLAAQIDTHEPLEICDTQPPVVVLPTERWNQPVREALAFALRLSPDVIGVHLSALDPAVAEGEDEAIRRQWHTEVTGPARQAGFPAPHLEVLHSPYRAFVEPLLEYFERLREKFPGRVVAVLLPVVKQTWWERLLHKGRAARLRAALLQQGRPHLVVIELPWHAGPPERCRQTDGALPAPGRPAQGVERRVPSPGRRGVTK